MTVSRAAFITLSPLHLVTLSSSTAITGRQNAPLNPLKFTGSDQKFTGAGQVQRQGTVTATLPVRVVQILPSGDLFVEGTKVVMVGEEEHHIYVSGIVRRVDIADDDSVPSSRIADAEIEYTGRGDISDTQRRGWLSRTLSKLWPF